MCGVPQPEVGLYTETVQVTLGRPLAPPSGRVGGLCSSDLFGESRTGTQEGQRPEVKGVRGRKSIQVSLWLNCATSNVVDLSCPRSAWSDVYIRTTVG